MMIVTPYSMIAPIIASKSPYLSIAVRNNST